MSFFGMGAWEITIILIAALVIFGPDRLPEMAGKIGKQIRDLRQMSSDLTGEFERTAGVQELKRSVQGELSGMKSQVNSVTSSVKKDLDKAGSKVSSTVSSAKSSTAKSGDSAAKVTTAKTGTSSTAKSTTAKTTAAAKPEPPKASKKDPLADVSFLEEIASAPATSPKPAAAAKPAASTVSAASPITKSNGASNGVTTQVDALSRARQRRQAAGYNRRPA
jgi:sec-independent protein translocase protein TatB